MGWLPGAWIRAHFPHELLTLTLGGELDPHLDKGKELSYILHMKLVKDLAVTAVVWVTAVAQVWSLTQELQLEKKREREKKKKKNQREIEQEREKEKERMRGRKEGREKERKKKENKGHAFLVFIF